MAENSAIEWTNHTFNPWRGCTAISAACDHCYAKVLVEGRLQQDFSARIRAAASTWKQPLTWNRKAAKEGRRARVFCASLADVFDAEVPEEWRLDLFRLILQTPNLDWLLLTKRPKIARAFLSGFAMAPGKSGFLTHNGDTPKAWGGTGEIIHGVGQDQAWPLPNVWLGTTVESRAMWLARGGLLKDTPAAVHFLSMEPLLDDVGEMDLRGIDWVITGGESGPNARPSHPDWFRSVRDQCAAAGVPFLFKQWGDWAPHRPQAGGDLGGDVRAGRVRIVHPTGEDDVAVFTRTGINTIPGSRYMARVGKRAAGRHLDGLLHDGYPVGA